MKTKENLKSYCPNICNMGKSLHMVPKAIYTKYSKHWPYTLAYTIDCVWSEMLNNCLNHGLLLSFFKLIPCPIHWIVCVLAYVNFAFEFYSRFSTAQNGPLCPGTKKYKFHLNCLVYSICISLMVPCPRYMYSSQAIRETCVYLRRCY